MCLMHAETLDTEKLKAERRRRFRFSAEGAEVWTLLGVRGRIGKFLNNFLLS